MMKVMLVGYYPLLALLVLLNSRLEARLGVSRATLLMEALFACAIFLPLTVPIFFDAVPVFRLLR